MVDEQAEGIFVLALAAVEDDGLGDEEVVGDGIQARDLRSHRRGVVLVRPAQEL